MTVHQLIANFRAKYPKTVWGRVKASVALAQQSLERGETPKYAFLAKYWRGANRVNAVVVFTNRRVLVVTKPIFGDYIESVNIEHVSSIYSERKFMRAFFTVRTLNAGGFRSSSSYSFKVHSHAAKEIQSKAFEVLASSKNKKINVTTPKVEVSKEIREQVAKLPEVTSESVGTDREQKLDLIKQKLAELKNK